MEKLQQIQKLLEQASADASKLFEKGTFSRGRSARLVLSEITKLCKQAREEILEHMKKQKEE